MRAGGTATLQEHPRSACPFPTSLGMWIPQHFLLRPFRALGISVSDTQAFGLGYCISPFQGFWRSWSYAPPRKVHFYLSESQRKEPHSGDIFVVKNTRNTFERCGPVRP